jgi:hypothetical protein
MMFDNALDLLSLAVSAVAVFTFILAIFEYQKSLATRRAEHFTFLYQKMFETEKFLGIATLLQAEDPAIRDVSISDKTEFIGIYEMLALSLESKLITEEIAFYMFGYYAIQCWKSEEFWVQDLEKDSAYWFLFRNFVERMEKVEKKIVGMSYEQAARHLNWRY